MVRRSTRSGWNAQIDFVGTLWTGKFIPKAIKETMAEVPTFAKPILERNSPVDTGYLRDNWRVQSGRRVVTIYNPAYYGGFVDLGTRSITPRRFVDKSTNEIVREFRRRASERILSQVSSSRARPNKRQRESLQRLDRGFTSVDRRPITRN